MTEVLPNPSNRSKRLPCSRQKGFLLNLEIKLSVKFWWPLFLAQTFTFLFLNLAKNHIFIPKCTKGGGPPVSEIFLNFVVVECFPNLLLLLLSFVQRVYYSVFTHWVQVQCMKPTPTIQFSIASIVFQRMLLYQGHFIFYTALIAQFKFSFSFRNFFLLQTRRFGCKCQFYRYISSIKCISVMNCKQVKMKTFEAERFNVA